MCNFIANTHALFNFTQQYTIQHSIKQPYKGVGSTIDCLPILPYIEDTIMQYRSPIGEQGTISYWHNEATKFYNDCSIDMPSDWLVRWVKVLRLTIVRLDSL